MPMYGGNLSRNVSVKKCFSKEMFQSWWFCLTATGHA